MIATTFRRLATVQIYRGGDMTCQKCKQDRSQSDPLSLICVLVRQRLEPCYKIILVVLLSRRISRDKKSNLAGIAGLKTSSRDSEDYIHASDERLVGNKAAVQQIVRVDRVTFTD